jgi:hypothetical protein
MTDRTTGRTGRSSAGVPHSLPGASEARICPRANEVKSCRDVNCLLDRAIRACAFMISEWCAIVATPAWRTIFLFSLRRGWQASRAVLTMVEQIESVVKPEAHGTHHLQAVKPGCRDHAAVAGLGRLRGLIAQRTNETHGPRIKRSGAPSTPTTIATATSAVNDVYMIPWHKE